MPDPIRSDEELEAELARVMADPSIGATEKRRIQDQHDAMMVARAANRNAVQGHYNAGKGRAPAKAWTEDDARAYAKGSDGR